MANMNGATMAKESEALVITNEADADKAFAEGKITKAEYTEHLKRFIRAEAKASAAPSRKAEVVSVVYVAPGSPTRRGQGVTGVPNILVTTKNSANASPKETMLSVAVWDALLRSDELKAAIKANSGK